MTESSRSTENVSAAYYDTESRKTALETKRERLLALLEKAENMEDIIALESALSDVQYEIESLSGTLRDYDRLISFSTVEIYLSEVLELCDEAEFDPDVDSLEKFFSTFPDDMPKEDAIAAVEDFYTWRANLSKVREIFENG